MRTRAGQVAVRLYRLDPDGGGIATIAYAPLADALALAAEQPATVQAELFVQTPDDVVAYLDLVEG